MFNSYILNSDNIITSVNGVWDEFALLNNGTFATKDYVLGRSIWSFVSGSELTTYLNAIVFSTRRQQRAIEIKYRCDSRSMRRHCIMRVAPIENAHLEIKHIFVSVLPFFTPFPKLTEVKAADNRCPICLNGRSTFSAHGESRYPESQFAEPRICQDCKVTALKEVSQNNAKGGVI